MIKNILILALLGALLVLTYPTYKPIIDRYLQKEEVVAPVATTTAEKVVEQEVIVEKTEEEIPVKKPVVIDADGALHDGPFTVTDKDGKDTGATAEIIRSPEETLLQFKNVSFTHSAATELHLAKDEKGKDYLNLGPARINSGVLIYGLPLDLDVSVFTHLIFYNPDTNVNEYSVAFE
jgi:hypothetical protein